MLPLKLKQAAYPLLQKTKRRIKLGYSCLFDRTAPATIEKTIRGLGVQAGDSLFVHSSLSTLGYIPGGAETVIAMLLKVLGEEGTLVMPTYPARTTSLEYIRSGQITDVRHTPSQVGKVTNVFRLMSNVRRSLHPTHSCAALGPQADWLLEEHHLDDNPFGKKSPFYKIIAGGGKALTLGIDLWPVTCFRVYESTVDDYPLKVFLDERLTTTVIDEEGRQHRVLTRVHNPKTSAIRRNVLMTAACQEAGLLTHASIRGADCYLLQLKDLLSFMHKWAKQGIIPYMVSTEGNSDAQ